MQKNTLVRKFMTLCLRKTTVFSFILCVSAVFGILGTLPQAQALSICHGDPIVTLSNGIKVHATVSISADSTRLGNLHVAYTFHIPVGVSVEKITYTGGSLQQRKCAGVRRPNQQFLFRTGPCYGKLQRHRYHHNCL